MKKALILADPLLDIINASIESGHFPSKWKQALITPVLKKGNAELLENYRPVSCLPAASKLLERIVCEQVSKFFEGNDLLPKNQHGFRANRSTMTAWADMQEDWTNNTEEMFISCILLWDLSTAFNTLDPNILWEKLNPDLYYWVCVSFLMKFASS